MQRTVLLISLLLVYSLALGQTWKTLSDTAFVKGDTLIVPELVYDLSHPLRRETNDSLDLVIDFLSTHPQFTVELVFHTDSRGSTAMNERLSDKRAKYACNYISSNLHTEPSRVQCVGYGERYLIITDLEIQFAKSLEEKEEMHSRNRRTELIIKEVK